MLASTVRLGAIFETDIIAHFVAAAGFLCVFLYWFMQTGLTLMPISKLRVLFWVKGVIVPPTFFALFLWAVIVTKG